MSYGMSDVNRRTITAMFDSQADANRAIERLVQAGIARGDIQLHAGSTSGTSTSTASTHEDKGFLDSLKDLFVPDEDRHSYAEGLRRGGQLVTVRTTDALYEKALDILDDDGTVNMDEREASWRSEGWTGYSASSTGASSASSSTSSGGSTLGGMVSDAAAAVTGSSANRGTTTGTSASATSTAGDREAIPVVEEQLRVGKRQVEGGRVRVRSYVVETPVQEQVTLREENVHVERRAVDRPVTDADRLFQERTIEAETRREEAVVSKEARVKEEIVIDKDVQERTQTVSDTVRRTEVEVEDERGRVSGTATGTTGRTDRNR